MEQEFYITDVSIGTFESKEEQDRFYAQIGSQLTPAQEQTNAIIASYQRCIEKLMETIKKQEEEIKALKGIK